MADGLTQREQHPTCAPRCALHAETGAGAIWRFIRSSEIGKELDWEDDEESDRAEAPARQQQQKQRKKREDGAALPAAAVPAPCPAMSLAADTFAGCPHPAALATLLLQSLPLLGRLAAAPPSWRPLLLSSKMLKWLMN